MKQYLEIVESLTSEEILIKQPQILKIEISSKVEAQTKLDENIKLFEGKNCIKRIHKCYHEEGKSCEIELLSLSPLKEEKIIKP